MFKVTYRPMWPGVLFTCLFIQMFVLLVTQVTIIKDYLLTYLLYSNMFIGIYNRSQVSIYKTIGPLV